jgi:hypothetical protein
LNCTFNLDSLPVAFATALSKKEDDTYDRQPLNRAIGGLADEIWKVGGFRFRLRRTYWDQLQFVYGCCQDVDYEQPSVTKGKRDSPRMERFKCNSKLILKPSFEQCTMEISIRHLYHAPYFDRSLSSEVVDFIQERTASSTPAAIFQELQSLRPTGWETTTEHQVYYQWQVANSSKWRRDPDPLRSAKNLLSERPDITSAEYRVDNVRGLAFYISDTIGTLTTRAKELAMDATFGTNNAGMDLFAVLAEVEGTGVPLAYCFMEVFENDAKGERHAMPGATSSVLCQFLQPLRLSGLNPTFFGTDKDMAEIFAVRQTWPNVTVQLCYWHARRAIRTKLAASQKKATQNEYRPDEAQMLIPELEICWGSMPIRRPDGQHRYGGCSCPSRPQFSNFPTTGRMETKDTGENETVINIFSNHFNAHPLIPDNNGTYRSAHHIHRDCAREMYSWCRSRNYFRLWAYLWVNWYQPNQWAIWARSMNESEIPVLKTTMIVESHWRKIKHDYLHRFNRPRIDLVVWVLLSRAIPNSLVRMRALLDQDHRRAMASWRKAFKHEWNNKKLIPRSNAIEDPTQRYHTNPARWSCGCPHFVNSRFLICKHILFFYEPISDPVRFFREVRRQRSPPFWVDSQLVLKPEYASIQNATDQQPESASLDDDFDAEEDEEGSIDPEGIDEDNLVSDSEGEVIEPSVNDPDESEDDEIRMFVSNVGKYAEIINDQYAMGNRKFIKKVMTQAGSKGMEALVEDYSTLEHQNTMPRTWQRRKNPASMYLIGSRNHTDPTDNS